tara:strand:+ start:83 stop:403 length:321 start_codon:yes stop_codon:yes gene_type:complete
MEFINDRTKLYIPTEVYKQIWRYAFKTTERINMDKVIYELNENMEKTNNFYVTINYLYRAGYENPTWRSWSFYEKLKFMNRYRNSFKNINFKKGNLLCTYEESKIY